MLCTLCKPTVQSCGGLVKPDIVFFGESLPGRFHDCAAEDFPKADLLIVSRPATRFLAARPLPPPVPAGCAPCGMACLQHSFEALAVGRAALWTNFKLRSERVFCGHMNLPPCLAVQVMGTSLVVHPFAGLIGKCRGTAGRAGLRHLRRAEQRFATQQAGRCSRAQLGGQPGQEKLPPAFTFQSGVGSPRLHSWKGCC